MRSCWLAIALASCLAAGCHSAAADAASRGEGTAAGTSLHVRANVTGAAAEAVLGELLVRSHGDGRFTHQPLHSDQQLQVEGPIDLWLQPTDGLHAWRSDVHSDTTFVLRPRPRVAISPPAPLPPLQPGERLLLRCEFGAKERLLPGGADLLPPVELDLAAPPLAFRPPVLGRWRLRLFAVRAVGNVRREQEVTGTSPAVTELTEAAECTSVSMQVPAEALAVALQQLRGP